MIENYNHLVHFFGHKHPPWILQLRSPGDHSPADLTDNVGRNRFFDLIFMMALPHVCVLFLLTMERMEHMQIEPNTFMNKGYRSRYY
jgi:hypothetical protein